MKSLLQFVAAVAVLCSSAGGIELPPGFVAETLVTNLNAATAISPMPDGKLYVALGEQTAGQPSQRLDTLQGKILRINVDGSIPQDNPFLTHTTGKYRAIWAYGLRNPFGLAFQPETKRLFESDVGESSWEEVNEILPG